MCADALIVRSISYEFKLCNVSLQCRYRMPLYLAMSSRHLRRITQYFLRDNKVMLSIIDLVYL